MRAAALLIVVIAGCGVADEAIIDDQPPEAGAEDTHEAAEAAEIELPSQVSAAIAALPDGSGWPTAEEFDAARVAGIDGLKTLECESARLQMRGSAEAQFGPVLLLGLGDTWHVAADADRSDQVWNLRSEWKSPTGLGTSEVNLTNDSGSLDCIGAALEDVQPVPRPFGAFVYASTLTTPEQPVWVTPINKEPSDTQRMRLQELETDAWSEARVQELIEIGPESSHSAWAGALAWANAEGRPDLAYEIHRRYRPVGYCSRDTRPLTTKEKFAELCQEVGRPRCHLNLTTQLLGYRVSRRSDMWIDGKPVSYQSRLDLLPKELDKELFMLGLLTDYPGAVGNEDGSVSPRFFALATDGSKESEGLEKTLLQLLGDDEIDAWNRHRFAVTVFYMRTYRDRVTPAKEHATQIASLDGVPAVTAAQLAMIE